MTRKKIVSHQIEINSEQNLFINLTEILQTYGTPSNFKELSTESFSKLEIGSYFVYRWPNHDKMQKFTMSK